VEKAIPSVRFSDWGIASLFSASALAALWCERKAGAALVFLAKL
jgi:hypothetical protein